MNFTSKLFKSCHNRKKIFNCFIYITKTLQTYFCTGWATNKPQGKKKEKPEKFSYIIKVADFYYEKTAKMMQKRIKDELNLNNSRINKISNTNFRVYLGPYNNLKSLKKAFDDINPLNFENIEIIKL